MAKIDIGNFGNRVAEPQQAVRVTGESRGTGVSEAAIQFGQTVQSGAMQEMRRAEQERQQVKDREAQTNAARVRITKANDLDMAADTLAEDIRAGRVNKAKADEEWQARRTAVLDGAFDGLDERYRGVIQAELDGAAQRKTATVRQAVTLRDKEDTRANLMNLGEEYQRKATKDRAGAVAEYTAIIDTMGPSAGMGPDDIAKAKQTFRENTAYTNAFSIVRGASQNLAAVKKARETLAGDGFADIDPQRRAALDAQLDGYETNILQRQAIAEQRAAAHQQAVMTKAQAAFTAAQARTDAGIPDSPEQVAITTQALAGTPFLETYRALQVQAREVGGFGAQPIAAQQKALDQVNAQIAQQGASDSLIKRRDSLQRVLDASKRDYGEDALRAGLQRGVIDSLPPVDISSVDAATRTIGQRLQAAQVVQTRTGRPVSPLTSDEAQALGTMLAALPVQQRATALAGIGTALGAQASLGLAAQIDPQDKALALALQFESAKTTAGRYTSELILKGQQAIKDKSAKIDPAAVTGWRAIVTGELSGVYANQKQSDDTAEAAMLIAAGMASEGDIDLRRAVRLAVGGTLVERNGKKIPLPAGVDEDAFDAKVRSLTPANFANQAPGGVVKVGSQAVPLDAFVQTLPDAQLISVGKGRFGVLHGGRMVTNDRGAPITIEAK